MTRQPSGVIGEALGNVHAILASFRKSLIKKRLKQCQRSGPEERWENYRAGAEFSAEECPAKRMAESAAHREMRQRATSKIRLKMGSRWEYKLTIGSQNVAEWRRRIVPVKPFVANEII